MNKSIYPFLHDNALKQKLLFAFLWICVGATFFLLSNVLLPFILSAMLAYVLNPLVSWIHDVQLPHLRLPRWVAVLCVYLLIVAFFTVLSGFFFPQFYRELIRLAKYATEIINAFDDQMIFDFAQKIEQFFNRYSLPVEIVAPMTHQTNGLGLENVIVRHDNLLSIDLIQLSREVINEIISYLRQESSHIVHQIQKFAAGVFRFVFEALLVIMLTGFILVDTNRIKRFLFNMVPKQNHEHFAIFLTRVDKGLSGVVRGQLLICLINAVLTLIGLLLLHVKFAFILAAVAGILSIVPIFGSILSTVPIVIVALTSSPLTGLFALLWIVLIHALEANFLNPKIMGNSAQIHPVLIVLSLIAGKYFYGITGAILAVPVASILLTIFNSILYKAHTLENQ